MFWVTILLIILLVVGASVGFGLMLQGRSKKRSRLSRQEQVTMAKASGAFPHRKESGS